MGLAHRGITVNIADFGFMVFRVTARAFIWAFQSFHSIGLPGWYSKEICML